MMNKAAKPVIITLAAALLLGGVLALLLLLPGKDEGKSSESEYSLSSLDFLDDEENYYPITAGKSSDLLTIAIKNANGEFSITRRERAAESGEAEYYHTVSGLGKVPQDDSAVTYFVDTMATLLGEELVEEHPQDLSKYGLNAPAATVGLDFDEGENITLKFGMRKPSDENFVYCLANDFVFLVDYYQIANALSDARAFAELVLTPKDGTPDNIRIERPDLEKPVTLRYLSEYDNVPEGLVVENTCKYAFTSPISLNVDPSKGKPLYEKLCGLEMTACEFTEKTDQILAECGFDTPSAVVTFTLGDTEHTLTFGGKLPDGSGYYATLSTADGVFSMDSRSAVWAGFNLGDVVSRTPAAPYIYACTSIEVTASAGKFTFTNEQNKFTYQGKTVDEFKDFFSELTAVPCDEFYTERTEGAAEFGVKFSYSEKYAALYGRAYDEISYHDCDGRKYVLNLNGDTVFKVSAIYVQRVIEDLNAITGG